MSDAMESNHHQTFFADVRAKWASLPEASAIRAALSADSLTNIQQRIKSTPSNELDFTKWPFLYGLIGILAREQLSQLEDDLQLVLRQSDPSKASGLTQFLRAQADNKYGDWYGGLFDIWSKATLLRVGSAVQLDYPLPNGRDHDICIVLNGRKFHLENTVITQDDESQKVWDRFIEAKKVDPSKVLVRPGPYCPPDSKGPSPYYDVLRFYGKVYDKITNTNLNPAKSQCAEKEPNVLLVSFAGPGVSAKAPGVGWALDELFASQPLVAGRLIAPHLTNITLDGWVDFTAKDRINKGRMTADFYCQHSGALFAAPRKLGGILIFDGTKLTTSRVNYNAEPECRISHAEMAELERLLSTPAAYWV